MPFDLATLSRHALEDETACIKALQEIAAPFSENSAAIFARARELVEALRNEKPSGGVEAFLHEYGLDTHEGVTIMCLAEALLRIPDAATADALIRDKLKGADWEKHLGQSGSLFVNASTWGLMLTGGIVHLGRLPREGVGSILGGLVGRLGEPVVRESMKTAMRIIGSQFVVGETIEASIKRAEGPEKKGYRFSYDMLGEGARTRSQAERYFASYKDAIAALARKANTKQRATLFALPSLSIKLSALHPRYEALQEARVITELLPKVKDLAIRARDAGISVTIDAEEATRLELSLTLFVQLLADPAFKDYEGLGLAVQAYQKRGLHVLHYLAEKAKEHKRRLPVRLVKGAYWDAEVKRAQMLGLSGYPVFTRKCHTDISYLACARVMLENTDTFFPQFATHNAHTVAAIIEASSTWKVASDKFEFQRLYGMGMALYDQLIATYPCRIYAPVGEYKDLLAYLIRRLLENGANTSFVHLLVDRETPLEELLEDPFQRARDEKKRRSRKIPLPKEIFAPDRYNSQGLDLGLRSELEPLQKELEAFSIKTWKTTLTSRPAALNPVFSPADRSHKVGEVEEATPKAVEAALASAEAAFPAWDATPTDTRAEILEKTANLLEKNHGELISLCMREAGKTVHDAIAEVREAADFCRYYAARSRELFSEPRKLQGYTGEADTLSLHGRGVFACISPWNFPLAIFMGQVAAALATGNTVIAKPAEQTPLIAHRAVELLREAGLPAHALHLLPGSGEVVGAALTKDARIAGVAFTGGTDTAQKIAQTLAARKGALVPFIAETGGQNCMIVDSSALPEQAVDDILLSAFGSAGQRCSALRVLYVQEEIADDLLHMLAGAMQELKLGVPWELTTDIGPVIDADALQTLHAHVEKIRREAKLLSTTPLPENLSKQGYFFPPHVLELDNIRQLEREVFGPVLHVIRFPGDAFARIIEEINGTGYGLTFGLHSRIEERWEYVRRHVRAGNIYVNRSMTGAVVGVQPFGGEGLSGTGFKAGGPFYLLRFATERTASINTAAFGGNLELLA